MTCSFQTCNEKGKCLKSELEEGNYFILELFLSARTGQPERSHSSLWMFWKTSQVAFLAMLTCSWRQGSNEERTLGLRASIFISSFQPACSKLCLLKNNKGVKVQWTHVLFISQSSKLSRTVMKEENHGWVCPQIATYFSFFTTVVVQEKGEDDNRKVLAGISTLVVSETLHQL